MTNGHSRAIPTSTHIGKNEIAEKCTIWRTYTYFLPLKYKLCIWFCVCYRQLFYGSIGCHPTKVILVASVWSDTCVECESLFLVVVVWWCQVRVCAVTTIWFIPTKPTAIHFRSAASVSGVNFMSSYEHCEGVFEPIWRIVHAIDPSLLPRRGVCCLP